jgi:FAD/FMN-containing dehydrogenase
MYPIDGAASRVKNSATPWAYRGAKWAEVIVGVDPDPTNQEKMAYVNFMMEEGEDRIRTTYGKNYARLAKIKKKYDPKNLFRVNQNIKPTN